MKSTKRNSRALLKQGKAIPAGSKCEKNGNNYHGTLPLCGKFVYLDIKDLRHSRTIETKLKRLGAVMESFLSKDINYVISTSAPSRSGSRAKGHGQGDSISPDSPSVANTPSPFSTIPSPTCKRIDGKIVPLTRGQAMAQIACSHHRSPSPSSTVISAEKLGIKIISVEVAERWLDKELIKLKHTAVDEATVSQGLLKKKKNGGVKYKKLHQPYIKIESCSRQYRPQYLQLTAWPHINLDTPAVTCPFDGKGVAAVPQSEHGYKDGLASVGQLFPGSNSTSHKRSLERDESLQLVAYPILTAGDLRRQQDKRKREMRRRGFCECCSVKYTDIDKHVQEQSHREFVRDKHNYKDLDGLIIECPSTIDFLHKILLQHCTQQAASKLPNSSHLAGVGDSSNDQVITLSSNSPSKDDQEVILDAYFPETLCASEVAANVPGYQTPPRAPQYTVVRKSPFSHTIPVHHHTVKSSVVDQEHTDSFNNICASVQERHADTKPICSTKCTEEHNASLLPAVVIRRPGTKGIYGSPRRKLGHGLSPGRGEPMSGQVRERSMIFGGTQIGSLLTLPEELASCTVTSDPKEKVDVRCGSQNFQSKDSCEQVHLLRQVRGREQNGDVNELSASCMPLQTPSFTQTNSPFQNANKHKMCGHLEAQNEEIVPTLSNNRRLQDSLNNEANSTVCSGMYSTKMWRESKKDVKAEDKKLHPKSRKTDERDFQREECIKTLTSLEESKELTETKCVSIVSEPEMFPLNNVIFAQENLELQEETIASKLLQASTQTEKPSHASQQVTSSNKETLQLCQTPNSHPSDRLHRLDVSLHCTPKKPGSSILFNKAMTPNTSSPQQPIEEENGSSPVYGREAVHHSTPVIVVTRKLRYTENAITQDNDAVVKLLKQKRLLNGKKSRYSFYDVTQTKPSAPSEKVTESVMQEQEYKDELTNHNSRRHEEESFLSKGSSRACSPEFVPCSTEGNISAEASNPSFKVKFMKCNISPSPRSSTKKVKLSHNWLLLSENSMSRLLQSEPEASPFEGFQGNETLPSDFTYEYASEVEVTDNEERVWLIDEEKMENSEEGQSEMCGESLQQLIPTFSSPDKRSDSSWDNACDQYLSNSVQKKLQKKQHTRARTRKLPTCPVNRKRKQPNAHGQFEDTDIDSHPQKRRCKSRTPEKKPVCFRMQMPSNRHRQTGGLDVNVEKTELINSTKKEDLLHVDEEIVFNYASPQKDMQTFSPLRVLNGNVSFDLLGPQQSPHTQSRTARLLKLSTAFSLN